MIQEHSAFFPLQNLLFNGLRDQSVAKSIQNTSPKMTGQRIQISDSPWQKKKA